MPSVLITGASRGLGLELARQYGAAGWQVFATCRRPRRAPGLAALAEAAANIRVDPLDVTEPPQIDALAERLSGTPIDVLINNAGVFGSKERNGHGGPRHAFGHTDAGDWLAVLRVNVIGPMKVAEAFVEHVATSHQRKLIVISSSLGSIGENRQGGWYPYRSSKAAVNAVVGSLAVDLAPRGITVAALNPGWVRTDLGGGRASLSAQQSVEGLRRVIEDLNQRSSGRFLDWRGREVAW